MAAKKRQPEANGSFPLASLMASMLAGKVDEEKIARLAAKGHREIVEEAIKAAVSQHDSSSALVATANMYLRELTKARVFSTREAQAIRRLLNAMAHGRASDKPTFERACALLLRSEKPVAAVLVGIARDSSERVPLFRNRGGDPPAPVAVPAGGVALADVMGALGGARLAFQINPAFLYYSLAIGALVGGGCASGALALVRFSPEAQKEIQEIRKENVRWCFAKCRAAHPKASISKLSECVQYCVRTHQLLPNPLAQRL